MIHRLLRLAHDACVHPIYGVLKVIGLHGTADVVHDALALRAPQDWK